MVSYDTTLEPTRKIDHGVFVGFNQFTQTVVFGACPLYGETYASFKRPFETFLLPHNLKHLRTIYTNQDVAMGKTAVDVFLTRRHGLCMFFMI